MLMFLFFSLFFFSYFRAPPKRRRAKKETDKKGILELIVIHDLKQSNKRAKRGLKKWNASFKVQIENSEVGEILMTKW